VSVVYTISFCVSCLQEQVRAFIEGTGDSDVLVLNVQDPFQRLLLHGVCEVTMFPCPIKPNSFMLKNLVALKNSSGLDQGLSVCSSIT
jgi:hypothetical protein